MITKEQFKKIAESNGYKLKKWQTISKYYNHIDIGNEQLAMGGYLIMAHYNGFVCSWAKNRDGKIGPRYEVDDDGNITGLCTSGNEKMIITSVEKCKDVLQKFTESYRQMKKQLRLDRIKNL